MRTRDDYSGKPRGDAESYRVYYGCYHRPDCDHSKWTDPPGTVFRTASTPLAACEDLFGGPRGRVYETFAPIIFGSDFYTNASAL